MEQQQPLLRLRLRQQRRHAAWLACLEPLAAVAQQRQQLLSLVSEAARDNSTSSR
jgi:hypothetical protein